jgi:hypothetical protein
MANRRAITKAQAVPYRSESRAVKSEILDAVCAVTGFNRDYALSGYFILRPNRSMYVVYIYRDRGSDPALQP